MVNQLSDPIHDYSSQNPLLSLTCPSRTLLLVNRWNERPRSHSNVVVLDNAIGHQSASFGNTTISMPGVLGMFIRAMMTAGLIAGSATTAALADGDKQPYASAPSGQVASQLRAEGVTPSKIKPDDDGYKVKGYNSFGQKEQFHVSPTGAITPKTND
jgi:hypothetical protein